jgi:MerR family transcriptional regulator, light-induced transcriptional regulator
VRKGPNPFAEAQKHPSGHHEPRHRSGAVARMLRMPVATLRVWERRYAVAQPELSASGQRLYSAADVRRLAVLKQLTDLGHAIGSLAQLDMQQLQAVASTHAQTVSGLHGTRHEPVPIAPPAPPWRLGVIGTTLASRLQRAMLLRPLNQAIRWVGPFADAAAAAASLQAGSVDALLIHEPGLHEGWLADFNAAAPALAAVPKAVLYGFASAAVSEQLARSGVTLLREPQSDAVIGQWLQAFHVSTSAARPTSTLPNLPDVGAPRRWNNAALADIAGLSSTIACECPRHVAELLVQLSQFEDYSAECEHRSAADAQLHAYLKQVAAAARSLFEAALEHVAVHEGLILPS